MIKLLYEQAANNHPKLILPPYDKIYEAAGFEAVCQLSELLGGGAVYVPSLKNIFRRCIAEEVKCEFEKTSQSVTEIARRYGISDRQLRRLIYGN